MSFKIPLQIQKGILGQESSTGLSQLTALWGGGGCPLKESHQGQYTKGKVNLSEKENNENSFIW